MATSSSTDFNVTRNELIDGALRLIGKAGRGKTANAADIADAAQMLEMWVKHIQTKSGIRLWKQEEATLFVEKGTASYSIPGANCTLSYVTTAVKVAAASGASTIDVDSLAGISDADYIGIQLDDGTMQWTTVNGAPSGDTIALAANTTDTVAVDNVVYTYTTQIVRPLKIVDARRVGTSDVPIDVVSREEYYAMPNKTSSGEVNMVYYDPQLTTSTLKIWPTGNTAYDKVELTCMMPIEDFDSSNINPDLPQEWLLTIKFNLAALLGLEYGIDMRRQIYLDNKAYQLLEEVSSFDSEVGSVIFEVDLG